MVFDRAADGSLSYRESVASGGLGTGASLGSQGGVVLSNDNQWLYAVNAGSNSVSSFEVGPDGLHLVSTFSSGGVMPTSLTTNGGLLYVLNAGGAGNIAGFAVKDGVATAIPGSSQPLSSTNAGGAQIQFNAGGTVLVVTEKATNRIVTYRVDKAGAASAPTTHASVGSTPFGFDVDRQDRVIVSEAPGSSASSYQLGKDGSLGTISASVPNNQVAACWVAISKDGRFAFTANAGSNDVSSYNVAPDGTISLIAGNAAQTAMQPLDMDISSNGRFLYVIGARSDLIQGFRIGSDGSLTLVDSVPVPAASVGVAAQ